MSVHDSMQKIANGTPVTARRDGEWVDGVYIGLDYDVDSLEPYEGHVVLTMDDAAWKNRYNYSIYDDEDVRVTTQPSPLDDYTTEELLAEVGRRCQ